ncbi:hypothetical protein ACQKWADRAFT_126076 [Trichoderma austrokoningii]
MAYASSSKSTRDSRLSLVACLGRYSQLQLQLRLHSIITTCIQDTGWRAGCPRLHGTRILEPPCRSSRKGSLWSLGWSPFLDRLPALPNTFE